LIVNVKHNPQKYLRQLQSSQPLSNFKGKYINMGGSITLCSTSKLCHQKPFKSIPLDVLRNIAIQESILCITRKLGEAFLLMVAVMNSLSSSGGVAGGRVVNPALSKK
jgi:hypothetical protein